MITLGAVSFLNTQPLVHGLDATAGVSVHYDVPSQLGGPLRRGETDAALVPVVELARPGTPIEPISDACIACDGETLTVRVFSRVPPQELRTLYVDTDSRTSIILAQLIWARWFKQPIQVRPLGGGLTRNVAAGPLTKNVAADVPVGRLHDTTNVLDNAQAVLLIGDKVVASAPADFDHQIDLGTAWKQWTGWPFVFAVWATRAGDARDDMATLLSTARDAGVRNATEIAAAQAPARGWPIDVAIAYLTRYMKYKLTNPMRQAMQFFLETAQQEGLLPRQPAQVAETAASTFPPFEGGTKGGLIR
jgi:chorismate dehydratase